MRVVAIAAVADNGVIGTGDDMLWHLREDFQRFKRVTMGHAYIEGRRTFDQLGVLPGRRIIVVTRDAAWRAAGVAAAPSVDAALALARSSGETICYIGGGAQIYAASLGRCTELDLTLVHLRPEGAARFPELDPRRWRMVHREPPPSGDERFEFSRWFPITQVGGLRLAPPSTDSSVRDPSVACPGLGHAGFADPRLSDSRLSDSRLSDEGALDPQDLQSFIGSWLRDGLGPWVIRDGEGVPLGAGGVRRCRPEAGPGHLGDPGHDNGEDRDASGGCWQLDLPAGLGETERQQVAQVAVAAATMIGDASALTLDPADETSPDVARRAGFEARQATDGGRRYWRRAAPDDAA